jgi:shikimate 5-dehydrogenase
MTKRRMLVGLIGANIQGSMSPALFADAFAAAGIDGYYHLLDVDRLPGRSLPQLLDAIKAAGFAGANVTYPFKQEVIPLLDAVDPEAAQVGAVNTVAIAPDGRTTGYNFDRRGWRNSFVEALGRDSAQGRTVVQVGAGGAGRAVAFAFTTLTQHAPTRSRPSCRRITVRRVAARPARLNTTSRAPMASSTPRRSACAAFPAAPFQSPRSRPRIGPPT